MRRVQIALPDQRTGTLLEVETILAVGDHHLAVHAVHLIELFKEPVAVPLRLLIQAAVRGQVSPLQAGLAALGQQGLALGFLQAVQAPGKAVKPKLDRFLHAASSPWGWDRPYHTPFFPLRQISPLLLQNRDPFPCLLIG